MGYYSDLLAIDEKLQEIWQIIGLYTNENMYNMDDSALFWKIIWDEILGTKQNTGGKQEKTH